MLSLGDAYSGFKLMAISATQVEFEHLGKATTLPVGKQITAEGIVQAAAPAAPAATVAPAVPAVENPGAPATPSAAADSATPAAPAPVANDKAANDKNEVLRRMMERREKEMSK